MSSPRLLSALFNVLVPLLILALGLSLILAPGLLGFQESSSAELCRVLGALTAAFATLAFSEALRVALWVCSAIGFASVLAPLATRFYAHEVVPQANVIFLIAGLLIAGMGLVEHAEKEIAEPKIGGGWRAVFSRSWTKSTTKITWS